MTADDCFMETELLRPKWTLFDVINRVRKITYSSMDFNWLNIFISFFTSCSSFLLILNVSDNKLCTSVNIYRRIRSNATSLRSLRLARKASTSWRNYASIFSRVGNCPESTRLQWPMLGQSDSASSKVLLVEAAIRMERSHISEGSLRLSGSGMG